MSARHKEGCHDEIIIKTFLCLLRSLSNDDVGSVRGTVFQEIRPGAGFILSLKKLGGLYRGSTPSQYRLKIMFFQFFSQSYRG